MQVRYFGPYSVLDNHWAAQLSATAIGGCAGTPGSMTPGPD